MLLQSVIMKGTPRHLLEMVPRSHKKKKWFPGIMQRQIRVVDKKLNGNTDLVESSAKRGRRFGDAGEAPDESIFMLLPAGAARDKPAYRPILALLLAGVVV